MSVSRSYVIIMNSYMDSRVCHVDLPCLINNASYKQIYTTIECIIQTWIIKQAPLKKIITKSA